MTAALRGKLFVRKQTIVVGIWRQDSELEGSSTRCEISDRETEDEVDGAMPPHQFTSWNEIFSYYDKFIPWLLP